MLLYHGRGELLISSHLDSLMQSGLRFFWSQWWKGIRSWKGFAYVFSFVTVIDNGMPACFVFHGLLDAVKGNAIFFPWPTEDFSKIRKKRVKAVSKRG